MITTKLKAPEDCPFLYYGVDKYGETDYFCTLRKHKTLKECQCTPETWMAGCPLLENAYLIQIN